MNAYQTADKAIAAYDSFVFASVGKPFNQDRADVLAWVAADECKTASRDRSMNQTTRMYYHDRAKEFTAIIAD